MWGFLICLLIPIECKKQVHPKSNSYYEEIDKRKKEWKPRKTNHNSGSIWKYAQTVGPAYLGAPTHPGGKKEVKVYADI